MKERCHSHRVVHAVVDELCTAATFLGIDSVITRAVIEERIYLFGYVARECLALDGDFVMKLFRALEQTIRGMDSLPALTRLVSEKKRGPLHVTICGITLQFWIIPRIVMIELHLPLCHVECTRGSMPLRMKSSICGEDTFVDSFRSRQLTYRGHLSGMEMHEVLKRGGRIHTIQLSAHPGTGQIQMFDVKKSKKLYFFDPKTLSKAELSEGPYHIAHTGAYHNSGESIYEPVTSF
ncbi:hypothetical protein JG688_00013721 [Phytophthora aleatoria]|uniref:Uncharacterized protein n=1 Tax=Phytophthora aleatoria TaxID=2496075 RepID=A0A8J5I8L2_9STRA|nr:hypothetical protein JG688_00013721 [Phytophthora aleatoria]